MPAPNHAAAHVSPISIARRMRRRGPTWLVSLLCLACYSEPSVVFVPDDGFHASLEISSSEGMTPTVRVGDPLVLHTRRTGGPWRAVARSSLPSGSCWWGAPPPPIEPEVADNVRWISQPAEPAVFNVAYREDRTREVRFSSPGVYRLWATDNTLCVPLESGDTITVQVTGG